MWKEKTLRWESKQKIQKGHSVHSDQKGDDHGTTCVTQATGGKKGSNQKNGPENGSMDSRESYFPALD